VSRTSRSAPIVGSGSGHEPKPVSESLRSVRSTHRGGSGPGRRFPSTGAVASPGERRRRPVAAPHSLAPPHTASIVRPSDLLVGIGDDEHLDPAVPELDRRTGKRGERQEPMLDVAPWSAESHPEEQAPPPRWPAPLERFDVWGWIFQANRSPEESGLRYRMTNASRSSGTTIAARVNGYVRSEGMTGLLASSSDELGRIPGPVPEPR